MKTGLNFFVPNIVFIDAVSTIDVGKGWGYGMAYITVYRIINLNLITHNS